MSNSTWKTGALDLAALDRFASLLASLLEKGDTVALAGDLGAGKTTFARALVGHIAGEPREITSPTYTLAQRYEGLRIPVTHVDCYRLRDESEAEELAFDEALDEGILLIEWPERIASHLPADRLEVALGDAEDEDRRLVRVTGYGAWVARAERFRALSALLDASGWNGATASWLQGDASARSYARLTEGKRRALLMNSRKMPDGPVIRDKKTYSAIAHLAEDVRAFVAVGSALHDAGLSAPEIYAHDMAQGFLVLEDLGVAVYGDAIASGADEDALYLAAVDVLLALRSVPLPETLPLPGGGSHPVPTYDREALSIETELLVEWFWKALNGEAASKELRAEFSALWAPLFDILEHEPPSWVLRDYHSPNLIWLPGREGVKRAGIIDFQDAVRGPAAYDLVSLTQDARRDVTPELEARLLAYYCERAGGQDPAFDPERFRTAYAILGAQRNTKILGIFARLALRDGKPGYLAHIPRVSEYLERNLAHPTLEDLRAWYDRTLPAAMRAGLSLC